MICFFSEESFFFLADLSNALELGYYIISDVSLYLFSPISSYERVNTKKIHSKFKDNLFLRVLLVSGRSRRSGATSHDVRKSNFLTIFWSNFQKYKKVHKFWLLTQSHILATTLVSPATVRNLEVWKCHLGQYSKGIDDVNKKADTISVRNKKNGCCAANPWDFPGFFDPDFSSASFASRATRSSS